MKFAFAAALGAAFLVLAYRATPGAAPVPVKPLNLGKVNTAKDEDDPYLAPDGSQLYYVSNAAGYFKIMAAQRARLSQLWPAGAPLGEINADGKIDRSDRRSPFLTDDDKFYFASNAVPRDPDKKPTPNFDLYHALKTGPTSFTQATPIYGLCTAAAEMHPWVNPKGTEFYFSRKTKEGWRVFVATGPSLGAIAKPKLVNLPAGFHHPTLSPSGRVMYLQGPLKKGRWGLFRVTRPRLKAPWGKPVELADLNCPQAPRGDLSPSLSPDGKRLFFASDRPGGKGGLDLWMVSVARLKWSR